MPVSPLVGLTRPGRRLRRICVTVALVLGTLGAGSAGADEGAGTGGDTVRLITEQSQLDMLARDGAQGLILELAPGVYDELRLPPRRAPAVVRSADPENPAILRSVQVWENDGLRLENLVFDYVFSPGDTIRARPFQFQDSTDITLSNIRVLGDDVYGTDSPADGFGNGYGLNVQGMDGFVLENSLVSGFHRGIVVGGASANVTIRGNEITDMRSDGINFAGIRDLLIEGNLIHSFRRSPEAGDHSDMIQFWTRNLERPSRNITIRHNFLLVAQGDLTQSLFMRNESVDSQGGGREMFYRNVLIEQNVIINSHTNGLVVGETDGLIIRNNTVVQNPAAVGTDPTRQLWNPRIAVAEASTRVRIFDNITSRIGGHTGQSDWSLRGNVMVQNASLMQPGHYTRVFAGFPGGDPRDLRTYYYRPDGILGTQPVGADALRQPN